MKTSNITCTVLLLLASSCITAQITTPSKPITKADVITFNKVEADYQKVQIELQQLEQKKKQLLTLIQAYDNQ